jgi:hypothetical protein
MPLVIGVASRLLHSGVLQHGRNATTLMVNKRSLGDTHPGRIACNIEQPTKLTEFRVDALELVPLPSYREQLHLSVTGHRQIAAAACDLGQYFTSALNCLQTE